MHIDDAVALLKDAVAGHDGAWADLGAGRGTFSLALARLLGAQGRVYAVERDGNAITELEAAISGVPNVTLVRADFTQDLALPEAPLDGLLFANTLHFVASPRGRSYALAIVEEAAFLPTDESVNPDVELIRALRPALARVPGSLLVVVSSPYARRGVLWAAKQRYHGQADGAVVLIQEPTLALNPTFDAGAIERAFAEDPTSAAAEYGAEFRADCETFISVEALEAVRMVGRLELPPREGVTYAGFVDPSGGGGADSFTAAVAHGETRGEQTVCVLDALFERRPPFSPEQVVAEVCAWFAPFRVRTAAGDKFAGEWPSEQFHKYGVTYTAAERTKSEIYRECLPLINSARVELLDQARLLAQLRQLERRVARGGRESIDHPPGGHDDVANAAAGALLLVGYPRPTAYTIPVTGTSQVPAGRAFRSDWWRTPAVLR